MAISSKVSFKCAVANSKLKAHVSSLSLINMACYPLHKTSGEHSCSVTLITKVNDEVIDIATQNQKNIPTGVEIDPKLAEYYYLNETYHTDELNILINDGEENAAVINVELEFIVNQIN